MPENRIIKEKFSFDFEGQKVVALWEGFYAPDGIEHPDKFLQLYVDSEGSEYSAAERYEEFSPESSKLRKALLHAKRIQIREELGILSLPCLDPAIAMKIIDKAHNGEWVGQRTVGYFFYESNLTEIMTEKEYDEDFQKVIDKLHQQEKIGLDGSIIVPIEIEKANYLYLEKLTGHKKLFRGDFGASWSCSYCYKNGDEDSNPNPQDVVCDPSEFEAVLKRVEERIRKQANETTDD